MTIAETYKKEGNAFFSKGDYNSALTKYSAAITNCTNNPILYSNRAATYINLKEWGKAINDCNVGLSLIDKNSTYYHKPVHVKLLFRKATALRNSNALSAALDSINLALTIEPDNSFSKSEFEKIQLQLENQKGKSICKSIEIKEVEQIPESFFVQASTPENVTIPTSSDHIVFTGTDTNSTDFSDESIYPPHPTVQFLSSLKFKPKSSLPSYFRYVLLIKPHEYLSIYKATGIDPEFLDFFMDACIFVLKNDQLEYGNNIKGLLTLFQKLPRFSLTTMFANSAKVEQLKSLFSNKLNEDLKSYWG